MLPGVVLVRLHDADGRKAQVVERSVVARTMTRQSGSMVPGNTARTFTTQVSTGIRDPGSPFTRVLWNETSRQPPHRSEIRSSSALIQRLAAPMPRVSLSVSDSV